MWILYRSLSFCTFLFWPWCSYTDSDYPFGIFKLLFSLLVRRWWCLTLARPICFVNFIMLLYRNNSPQVDTSLHLDRLFRLKTNISLICPLLRNSKYKFYSFWIAPTHSEIMVWCKRVSGIWTVLRSLLVKYNSWQLSTAH
jgi:hypothetical protein